MEESNGAFCVCESSDEDVAGGDLEDGLLLEEAARTACACSAANALVEAILFMGGDKCGYSA